MALLTAGPLLENLKVYLRLCNAGVANRPQENEDPRCKTDLPVYLKELTKRARNVKIDYELGGPVLRTFFHDENLIQLEQLGQQLHYRAVKKASFLGLSRECRDMVYRSLLSRRKGQKLATVKWMCPSETFPTALLRTCSQIKEEAAAFLYSTSSPRS